MLFEIDFESDSLVGSIRLLSSQKHIPSLRSDNFLPEKAAVQGKKISLMGWLNAKTVTSIDSISSLVMGDKDIIKYTRNKFKG